VRNRKRVVARKGSKVVKIRGKLGRKAQNRSIFLSGLRMLRVQDFGPS